MEKQTTLSSTELEKIFAQIKSTGNDKYGDAIYNAYLPQVKKYAKAYNLKYETVTDIFDEVISFIYDKILSGIASAHDFDRYFTAIMERKCIDARNEQRSEQHKFESSMLKTSYDKRVQANTFESLRKEVANEDRMSHSLLYTIQVLKELKENEKLAQEYGLSKTKILIFEDYYGINSKNKRYSIGDICEKYSITETKARAIIVNFSKHMREIEALANVRNQLK